MGVVENTALGVLLKRVGTYVVNAISTNICRIERVGDFEILRDSRIRILPPINFNIIRILFEVFRH